MPANRYVAAQLVTLLPCPQDAPGSSLHFYAGQYCSISPVRPAEYWPRFQIPPRVFAPSSAPLQGYRAVPFPFAVCRASGGETQGQTGASRREFVGSDGARVSDVPEPRARPPAPGRRESLL